MYYLKNKGHKTGFWIEEFAAPYYELTDKGVQVTLASPKGGQPPIDPKSSSPENQTEATVRFNGDKALQGLLSKTLKLETVKQADYDAIFYPGGYCFQYLFLLNTILLFFLFFKPWTAMGFSGRQTFDCTY